MKTTINTINAKVAKMENKINSLKEQNVILENELKKGENKKIRNKLIKNKNLIKNLQDQINKIKKEELGTTNSSRKDSVSSMNINQSNHNTAVNNDTAKVEKSQGRIKISSVKQAEAAIKVSRSYESDGSYRVLRLVFKKNGNIADESNTIRNVSIEAKIINKPYNAMTRYMDICDRNMITKFGTAELVDAKKDKWSYSHQQVNMIKRATLDQIEIKAEDPVSADIAIGIRDIIIKDANSNWPEVFARIEYKLDSGKTIEHFVLLSDRSSNETRVKGRSGRLSIKDSRIFVDENGKYLKDLLIYPMANSAVLDKNGKIKAVSRHNSSAAALKDKTMTVFKASGDLKVIEAFDCVCSNVSKEIFEYVSENKVASSKAFGFANRLGLSSPSTIYNDPEKYCTKVDVILTSTFCKVYGNEFIDCFDGQDFISAEAFAEAINSSTDKKFEIKAKTLVGKHIQSRLYFAHKAKSQIVSQKELNYIVKKLSEKYEVVLIRKDQVTNDIQQKFRNAVLGKTGPYSNKLIVVYDRSVKDPLNAIDTLTDLNALKSSYDLKAKSNVNMLKDITVHKYVEEGGSLSNQMLQTCLEADYEGTIEHVTKLLTNKINNSFDSMNKEVKHIAAEELESVKIDTATLLAQIAPSYVLNNDRNLYKSFIKNLVQGSAKDINEVDVQFAGNYAAVVPDVAAIYGGRFLNICKDTEGTTYIEVLSRHAEQNNVKELVMVKYPKNHLQENAYCRVVSVKEYCKRVDVCKDLTKEEKAFVKQNVRNLNDGCVMIPAYSIIKNMLAGLDFDSDAVQMFYDEFIIKTYKKVGMKAIVIETPTSISTDKHYDSELGLYVWHKYCSEDRETVGQVTVMNMIFISLRHMLKYGTGYEKDRALEIFANIFSSKSCKYSLAVDKMKELGERMFGNTFCQEYKEFISKTQKSFDMYDIKIKTGVKDGIDYDVISVDDATQIVFAAYHMEKDVNGVLDCIDKLLDVQRMYQELTIDTVKKDYLFDILYKTNNVAKLLSRDTFDLSINWKNIDKEIEKKNTIDIKKDSAAKEFVALNNFDSSIITKVKEVLDKEGGSSHMFYNIADPMHIVKVNCLPVLGEQLQTVLAKEQKVHPMIMKMIKDVLGNEELSLLVNAVYSEKANYGNINSAMKEELKDAEEDVEQQAIKAKYNEFFNALSNNIRCLFAMNNITDNNTKVAVLLSTAAVADEDGEYSINTDGWGFASRICSEEYAKFVIENFAETKMTYNKVAKADATVLDGDSVEFHNGFGISNSGQVSVLENLNGIFTYREDKEGNRWIEKPIADTIIIPEADFSKRFIVSTEHQFQSIRVSEGIYETYTVADAVKTALSSTNEYDYVTLAADKITARAKQEAGTIKLVQVQQNSFRILSGTELKGAVGKMFFKLGRNVLRRDFYNGFSGTVTSAVRGTVIRNSVSGLIKRAMVFITVESDTAINPNDNNRKAAIQAAQPKDYGENSKAEKSQTVDNNLSVLGFSANNDTDNASNTNGNKKDFNVFEAAVKQCDNIDLTDDIGGVDDEEETLDFFDELN